MIHSQGPQNLAHWLLTYLPELSSGIFIGSCTKLPRYPLRLIISSSTRVFCITAPAGTKLGDTFVKGLSPSIPKHRILRHIAFISFTQHSWIKVTLIVQGYSLLPL